MGIKEDILASHNFTFSELSPGNGSNEQPYVKFLMFIKKKPGISDEKFHEWWKTVHADLALTVENMGGVCLRYEQVGDPTHRSSIADKEQLIKANCLV